jgi:natural product precursor
MTTRKFDKKLVLNKRTVSHLDNKEMKNLHGGAKVTQRETLCPPTCLTCNWECL